jgi:hypothetical protein
LSIPRPATPRPCCCGHVCVRRSRRECLRS